MKTLPQFHPASVEDVDAVLALIRELYAHDQIAFDAGLIGPALSQLLVADSLGRVWLIRQQGMNVGYLILTFGFDLEFGGRQATVTDLYLQAQARRQGAGTAALALVEETCRSLGIRAFELQVAGANHAAQHFYERYGMDNLDRIPMSKVLEYVAEEKNESHATDEYLQMIWPQHLLKSPLSVTLPPGYSLRTYQAGDEPKYYELMALAGFPEWNADYLTEWIGLILPGSWFMAVHEKTGEIVATAMGCHDHSDLHPFGAALGWVAGHPAHSGKGLGAAVSAAVTARLIDMGYRDIHLHGEDERLAALKIYLRLGYIPFLYSPGMEGRWQAIYGKLGWSPGPTVSVKE